ncbi:MAG: ABC transporter ATP-binding protein [Spirochaetia bacterium]|jgi:iron complex transport system ATP-binding protein|nr:ABC transporter ATP-binding protein [Spirochaetia bacterium]
MNLVSTLSVAETGSNIESPDVLMEARKLSAGYGQKVIVSQADFSIQPGSLLVVLGPNGCGKTTVLKTCLGLIPALSGQALLGGRPVERMLPRERARLAAWVPQIAETVWSYKARDIVAQGRYAIRGAFKRFDDDDTEAIENALATMDIKAFADRRFSSLSGGEARRVMIARALAQEAPLLVLDEPAAHMDPGRQMELMEMLLALAKTGKAVAVSVHDVNAARRFADLAVLVDRNGGSVFGRPEDILDPERLEEAYDTYFIHGSHESYGNYVLPVSRKRRQGE